MMRDHEPKPATVVVHDHTLVGDATVEAMSQKRLAFRQTTWSELDLRNALGIITIPPTRGESIRSAVLRARQVLDSALAQGARVVQCHHPGALGRSRASEALDVEHRGSVDSSPYFHREYVREMEIYRYLELGVHVVPLVIGLCVDRDGSSDWGLRESLSEWSEYLHWTQGELDVVSPASVGAGIVSALQQARPGRRYVFGGSGISAVSLGAALEVEMRGPISLSDFASGVETLGRFFPDARERLRSGLEPLLFGATLDSTRARGELGYMPRAPIFG